MKSDPEIKEIAQVIRTPGLPESALLVLLRGLESDAVADGSSSTIHSVADVIRPVVHPVTGAWNLPALEAGIRRWLDARGFGFPPPRPATGPQPALRQNLPGAEFPEPEGSVCGTCQTGIYRFREDGEWRHQNNADDADHVPAPAGSGA